MDETGGTPLMDGFGGYCSNAKSVQCFPGQLCGFGQGKCVLAGYEYYNAGTNSNPGIPGLWQLASTWGLSDGFFSYPAGPSYGTHLAQIAASTAEAVDNPYTPGNPAAYTCDDTALSGTQPVCNGLKCTGGYNYQNNVLSRANASETILGTVLNQGDYYIGGTSNPDGTGTACICNQGPKTDYV
jgi:hypothetical protein